jgi:hypothetical protein
VVDTKPDLQVGQVLPWLYLGMGHDVRILHSYFSKFKDGIKTIYA